MLSDPCPRKLQRRAGSRLRTGERGESGYPAHVEFVPPAPGLENAAVPIWPQRTACERGLNPGLSERGTATYHPGMRLVDSHCHLNAERFAGDEQAVLDRARTAGVERILVPGWNLASSTRALQLVDRFEWLDASVGVHPHDAAKVDEAGWREIVAMAADPRVVAIGETGLDYDRVFSPIPDQLTNLRRNLDLALETGKPAIVHVRSKAGLADAQDSTLSELGAAGFGSQRSAAVFGDRPPAVIHSFSGSVDYARRILDLGLAISISGLAFRAGEEATADVIALVPAERLLVETDAPFLSPPGAPKGRNEPEYVRITAEWAASRGAETQDGFGEGLVQAYGRVFGKP